MKALSVTKTSVNWTYPAINVINVVEMERRGHPFGIGEVTVTLRGEAHEGLIKTIQNSYGKGVYLNTDKPREEWFCLYCAVPNHVERNKCEQCGAPRNWCF